MLSKTSVTAFIWFLSAFLRNTSPPVTAQAAMKVPDSILSGIIVYSEFLNLSVPVISIVLLLLFTSTETPIVFKNSPKAIISGSTAAFLIIVFSVIKAAASIMFSVAPTLGNFKFISA